MNLETELSPIEEEFGFGEEHNFEHYENTEQGEHDYLVTDDLFSLDYRLPSDEFDDGLKFGRGDGYENDYEYGTRGETINEYELNEEGLYGEYSEEVAGEFLNEEQSHGSEWMEEMYEEVFGGLLL